MIMIDPSLALPEPALGERKSRRGARDTTRMYVRLAQQRANRGEPLDGTGVPAQGGLQGLLRRLWSRQRSR